MGGEDAEQMTRLYTFASNIEYIKSKRGEMGVKLVLDDLHKKGYNLDIKNIKSSEWVPISLRKEFLYSVRDALGWNEENIYDMGRNAPRFSYALKIYIGLFITVEKALEAPNLWRKHYSSGTLELSKDTDLKKGIAKYILRDFDVDPLFCKYLEGYLQGFGDLTKSKNVVVKETKCTFKGDPYHEYTITWDVKR